MRFPIIILVIIILVAILMPQALFTVDETQSALVTRFGEVKKVITKPGISLKTPFVDSVTRFDSRLLRIDMPSESMPDQDKQNLDIDAYARYRILDPEKFFKRLGNEGRAASRIGAIIVSELREEVARRSRQEIIGGRVEVVEGESRTIATDTRSDILAEVLTDSQEVIKENGFGVQLVDVRMKRADFPDTVARSIFNRMESERKRIAEEFRAVGREENLKLRALVDRDRVFILAEAQRESNILRGEGEAQAIEIFSEALEQDPEFYAFLRSLEAYQMFLASNTTVVLSSDADIFKYLQDPTAASTSP